MKRKMPKSYNMGMIVLLFLCAMYIVVYPVFQKQEAEQNAQTEEAAAEAIQAIEEAEAAKAESLGSTEAIDDDEYVSEDSDGVNDSYASADTDDETNAVVMSDSDSARADAAVSDSDTIDKADNTAISNSDTYDVENISEEDTESSSNIYYEFRSYSKFQGHYEKHGIEMGFDSPEEYLDAANALINNPEALHKYEEEDGDDVYFLESTNEIAFVSSDGYLRTYFICSGKSYYDKQ